jgi:hypothetical protein
VGGWGELSVCGQKTWQILSVTSVGEHQCYHSEISCFFDIRTSDLSTGLVWIAERIRVFIALVRVRSSLGLGLTIRLIRWSIPIHKTSLITFELVDIGGNLWVLVGISYLKSFISVKDLGLAFYWSRAFVSTKRGWGNASRASDKSWFRRDCIASYIVRGGPIFECHGHYTIFKSLDDNWNSVSIYSSKL